MCFFWHNRKKSGSARQQTASPVLIELTTSIAWQRDLHGSVENCGAILVCLPFGRTICSWFSPLAWKNRGWFGCYSKNCSLACLPPTNHERSNSQRLVFVRSRRTGPVFLFWKNMFYRVSLVGCFYILKTGSDKVIYWFFKFSFLHSKLWNQVPSLDHLVIQNSGNFLCWKYR